LNWPINVSGRITKWFLIKYSVNPPAKDAETTFGDKMKPNAKNNMSVAMPNDVPGNIGFTRLVKSIQGIGITVYSRTRIGK